MLFVDEIKQGVNIMLHPKNTTAESKSIGGIFTYYYKLSVIPLILAILISLAFASLITSGMSSSALGRLFARLRFAAAIIFPIFVLWVLLPIAFFVDAGLLQIFGKLFKQFKAEYTKTLNAVIYGSIPIVLFYWISMVPLLGTAIGIIMGLWGFAVLVIALANQQKLSNFASFGIIVLTSIIVSIVVFIIGASFAIAAISAI